MAPPLRDLLFHPDTFFEQLAAGADEYRMPIIIVALCMVFDAIRQFILMDFIAQFIMKAIPETPAVPMMAGMMKGMINILIITSTVQSIPAFFAYWLIIAAVFFIISGLFTGEGSIYKVFIATGWGMIPFVLYNAISVALIVTYRQAMDVTISPEFFNLTGTGPYSRQTPSALSDSPDISRYITFNQPYLEYSHISFALFAAAFLCCCVFWVYAMKHTRSLTMKQSAITVVLPVIIYLACLLGFRVMNGWM